MKVDREKALTVLSMPGHLRRLDRAADLAQAEALKRAALREMVSTQVERRARPPLTYNRGLWRSASLALSDVYGTPDASPEIVAAVKLAKSAMRNGSSALMAMGAACTDVGVERDDLARAILKMKGARNEPAR